MKRILNRRGFTLVEMVTVMFILLLLISISIIWPVTMKMKNLDRSGTQVPTATGEITDIRGSLSLAINTQNGAYYIDVINDTDGPQTIGNLGVRLKIGDTIEFPLTKPDKETSLFSPEGLGVLNANDIKILKSRPTTSPVEK